MRQPESVAQRDSQGFRGGVVGQPGASAGRTTFAREPHGNRTIDAEGAVFAFLGRPAAGEPSR